MKPFSWAITKPEFDMLIDKLKRGSNGGKQMAKLSSKESIFLDSFFDCLYTDYPDYIESVFKK